MNILRRLRPVHLICNGHGRPLSLFSLPREDKLPELDPGFKVYYRGNLTKFVRMLKTFSISTTITGLMFYQYAIIKLGILDKSSWQVGAVTTLCGGVILSPLLTNLMTKRYIIQLAFNNETNVFKIYSLNLINQLKTTTFTADQVNSTVNRPLTTFMVGRKPFFIDPLQFSDISVYEHLMGFDKIKHLIEDENPQTRNKTESDSKTAPEGRVIQDKIK